MKPITALIPVLLCGGPLAAQQVFCAGGQEYVNVNRSIAFTIGEPVNATVEDPSAILTQGFEQPWADITTGVAEGPMGEDARVYPNPTRHVLYVDQGATKEGTQYELLNAAGARVMAGSIADRIATLDMEGVASGGYLLRLHDPDQKTIRTFKISVTR